MDKKGKAWRVKAQEVNFERLDDEVVAIHLPTGMYFSMENAAVEMWAGIEMGADFDRLAARLVETYDVPTERAETDVAHFLDRLAEENLIEEAPTASSPTFAPAKPRPYTGLHFEKFSDLQYLLMIDPVHEVKKEGWPRTKEG